MLAAGLAVVQGNRAEDERAIAEAQARDLAVQELVARANVLNTTKRDLAALLAVAAYEVDPSVETYGGLVAAFTSAPSYERTIPLDESTGAGALVSPDGRSLFVIGSELAVTEVDLRTGHRREVLDGVDPEFQPAPRLVALSPDGSRLARLSSDSHAVLSFVYKAAAEIGELGDNTRRLRTTMRDDELLHVALQSDAAHVVVLYGDLHLRHAAIELGPEGELGWSPPYLLDW